LDCVELEGVSEWLGTNGSLSRFGGVTALTDFLTRKVSELVVFFTAGFLTLGFSEIEFVFLVVAIINK
jgi:hypothetical protein